jgi:CubicO group peptidase (beta-lactamase class C family)
MKNIQFLVALIVFGLLVNPLGTLAQGGIKLESKTLSFDKTKFVNEIYKRFDSKAMGYQVILMKKGQIAAEVADGWARNVEDGNVKMTLNTPANIGSTVKFFAGTALLQKLQKGTYLGGGFNTRLLEPAYRYFPKIWQDNMHVSIQKITLKDLLQHKGGFIHNDPDPSLKVYFDYLKKGVSMDKTQAYAYGKRNYANANITLIGYILAAVDNPEFLTNINKIIAAKNLKADDPLIQTLLGQAYENYMKANIFSKIKPAIAPSCDAPNEYPANVKYAKSYALPSTVTKGAEYSSKVDNVSKACHAAGGWYMTGRELAAYVANFAATETIVKNETRDMMFDDEAAQNQLLWSMNIPNNTLLTNFDWKTSPYMGGDHGGAHATIVELPNDYYAVGIINSGILDEKGKVGSSYLLTLNIIEAFNAGVDANF